MLLSRDIDLDPHPNATLDAMVRGIAAELQRNGSRVTRVAGGVIEFDGPGLFYFGFSMRRKSAGLIHSGVITVDPAARRARMELRPSRIFYLLAAWMCWMMAMDSDAESRAFLLFGVATVTMYNVLMARWAFTSWTLTGARQTLAANAPPASRIAP